ncbi:hypothetical protein Catovirus_1_164 [Catovirus CTV1]|uniref:Uncharacterized protein n=1 Tax=Catovirus CTV1 TaxID=1977631 RepID=A0A1V0S8T3_9VIRU|nr:hypothetical protein Catovirus_1_164 [Catovirus CTV1]
MNYPRYNITQKDLNELREQIYNVFALLGNRSKKEKEGHKKELDEAFKLFNTFTKMEQLDDLLIKIETILKSVRSKYHSVEATSIVRSLFERLRANTLIVN